MLMNAKMTRVIQMQNAITLMDISIVYASMILLEMEHFALQVRMGCVISVIYRA